MRPILFSAPMVRAILQDRKWQTRRIIKPQPFSDHAMIYADHDTPEWRCPYGDVEDYLWVRETWALLDGMRHFEGKPGRWLELFGQRLESVHFRADAIHPNLGKWRPSIFMPKWASRITLKIIGCRTEKLHDITEGDAKAEGVDTSVTDPSPIGIEGFRAKNYVYARECFADLWRLINGSESWEANPWVWVITFKRMDNLGHNEPDYRGMK